MRIRFIHLVAISIMFLSLATLATSAAEVEPSDSAAAAADPVEATPASPMMLEIREALIKKDTALESLQQELKAAGSESEALAILRVIGQQKQDTEIEILRIQEEYARGADDLETAEKIAEAIERILNPPAAAGDEQARRESEERKNGDQGHE